MPLRSLNVFQRIACGWDVNAIAFIDFFQRIMWVGCVIAFIE